jgi:perosamine synthetase
MIPLSAPNICGNEWQYIKECLDTGWVSSVGSYVSKFEKMFAEIVGSKYAIATCNGTSALHISMLTLGLNQSHEVLVPTITFAATINAVHYCNASPIFFDCDKYFNLDLDSVEQFLKEECKENAGQLVNKTSGRPIWGIVPVHIFGTTLDMPRVIELCNKYKIKCLEDAAESLGSYWGTKHSGTFSELGCFSFNGNKIITTGGGGMVVTDSESLATKVKYLTTQAKDDSVRFIHNEIGYNYRLTNIQAAMGVAQLEQLGSYLDKKKQIYSKYKNAFSKCKNIHVVDVNESNKCNYWLTNIGINNNCKLTAMDIVNKLSTKQIESRPIWYPNHLQVTNKNSQSYKITKASEYVDKTVSLPSSVGLSEQQQNTVIEAVLEVIR